MIICPQCGELASSMLVHGITIAVCSHCNQATVLEREIIIRLSIDTMAHGIQRDLLAIALAAQALYKNWNTINTRVSMGE